MHREPWHYRSVLLGVLLLVAAGVTPAFTQQTGDAAPRVVLTRLSTPSERKRTLAKPAFEIRLAYFDNRKRCTDVIPQVLLIHGDREESEIRPSRGYASFLQSTARE